MRNTFRSLKIYNYRLWAAGALVSNVGTWMQRTAQDWLVLTELTHNNATALGTVMALQFGPQVLMLPFSGYAADHFDRRKLLILTQGALGALALGLGLLTVTGLVQLWQVYVFAFLLGCVTAFDMPARQVFVSELVGERDLTNAVGLNSTSFNSARMVGPAVAGLLIAGVGTGPVFLINGVSFFAVIVSLLMLRKGELFPARHARRAKDGLVAGFRYVWGRADLKSIVLMRFLIGTFGLNFTIFIATMAVNVFHSGSGKYGALRAVMAIGSVSGALMAAGREMPGFGLLIGSTALFGAGFALSAVMPTYALFGASLIVLGVAVQTFMTSSNSLVQLTTEPDMRGRVMAILIAVTLGGTPIGAPICGWAVDHFGARWAMGVSGLSGFIAAGIGLWYMIRHRGLTFSREGARLRVRFSPDPFPDMMQNEADERAVANREGM